MELIKDLGTRLMNKTWVRFGLFLCPFCLKEIEKSMSHGKRDKSCGCASHFLTALFHKGKKRTEKTKLKMRENHIDFNGENNPFYGKKHTEESNQKNRKSHEGKKQTEEFKQKQSELHEGKNHWNWQNGKSFELYGIEFNKKLKQSILERDNYECQNPNCEHLSEGLNCHHIDYDKKNNIPENLITLCKSCHTKTNYNREYWIGFYQNIMMNKILEGLL